jgi:tetratricopeptide (TPR) repeat protein
VPAAPDPNAAAHELFDEGNQLAATGDSVRAEQYLAAALREGYPGEEVLPPLLRVCLAGSRLRAALNYATPYLKKHPDAVWLRYLVATVYLGLGQPLHARENLLAIEGQAPYAARVQYLLGETEWEGFGDAAAAAGHFREYLRVEPEGAYAREVSEWLDTHGTGLAAGVHTAAVAPEPLAAVPVSAEPSAAAPIRQDSIPEPAAPTPLRSPAPGKTAP